MGVSVFGTLQYMDAEATTLVFIVTVIGIILLETLFKFLSRLSIRFDQMELFVKLQYELMLLGIISFALFLILQAFAGDKKITKSQYFASFEIVHIIILFIALSFMAQAILLVVFSKSAGRKLLQNIRLPPTALLKEFDGFGIQKSVDEEGQVKSSGKTTNISSKFWKKVEMKINESLFKYCHKENIPPGFNYGIYIGYLSNKYLAALGEVSVYAWFLLGLFIFANYGKTVYISKEIECGITGIEDCIDYYFTYPLFCIISLNITLLVLWLVSDHYYHKLINEGLSVVNHITTTKNQNWCNMKITNWIESWKRNELSSLHIAYIQFLEVLQEQVSRASTSLGYRTSLTAKTNKSNHTENEHFSGINSNIHNIDEQKDPTMSLPVHSQLEHIHSYNSLDDADLLSSHVESIENEKNEKIHQQLLMQQTMPWYKRYKRILSSIFLLDNEETEKSSYLSKFFLFGTPSLYFFTVKFVFLLQSLYLSIYFTQLLPQAKKMKAIGWGVVLGVMPLFAFLLMKFILEKAVILHSTVYLDDEIVVRVCEETSETIKIGTKVHDMVFNELTSKKLFNTKAQIKYMNTKFDEIDLDKSGLISKGEFRAFLGSLKVFLSAEKFDLLWKVVDDDLSGQVSKNEMLFYFFPEEKLALQKQTIVIYKLSKYFERRFLDHRIPKDKRRGEVYNTFALFDHKSTGLMNKDEFKRVLIKMSITVHEKDIEFIMTTLNQNEIQQIQIDDLVQLVLPPSTLSATSSRANVNDTSSITGNGSV